MPDFRMNKQTIAPHIQSQVRYLYRDDVSERLFKMYKRGFPLRRIANKCAVSTKAVVLAYPSLNWSDRGVITFFKNHARDIEEVSVVEANNVN